VLEYYAASVRQLLVDDAPSDPVTDLHAETAET
jgi:hypothetical protein